ncbi:MAG: MMPL family transporter [Deltaproteobacteria bacterium]|nr:MMPL family transporter [Deltaproteobacteria bacterium]
MPLEEKLKKPCAAVMDRLRAPWIRWSTILLGLVLAGASIYYTAAHLKVETSRKDLISSNQKLIKRTDLIDRAFGGRDGLVVLVENTNRSQSVRFANELAKELRRYPDRFPDLFYRLDVNSFKPWALLYPGIDDLLKIKNNLAGQKKLLGRLVAEPRLTTFYGLVNEQIAQVMIGTAFTGFLHEEQTEELPDVSLLNATLRELRLSLSAYHPYVSPFGSLFPGGIGDLSEQGYFFTDNDRFLMFLVTSRSGGYTTNTEDLDLLRKVLSLVQTRFPGIKAGVTGPDALQADEMSSAMRDITLATWLSLMGQFGLLVIFLRALRRPLVEVFCLIIGLCWTFGMVTLVVGHLNLLSIIFAPLMLGLAIDYGIHWFARLEEEDAVNQYRCTPEAVSCAYRQTLPGITYAALAAMVSFLPLAFVNFKGLRELGLILTLGLLIMVLATLILAPSLVLVFERCLSTGRPHQCPGEPPAFLHLKWRHPGWVVAAGATIICLGLYCLLFHAHFDLNPLHLQNPKVDSVIWEMRLLKESKYSTSFGAMTANSVQDLEAKTEALKKLSTVSHVESVLSFLPADVKKKRPIIKDIQSDLAGIEIPATRKGTSDPQRLASLLSRINFKMDEASKSLEEKQAATKGQIEETHALINKIIPLLDSRQNPQVMARLSDFEWHFFADLHDKWNLLRNYEKSALESPPMTLQDLPQQVRERFIGDGGYLIRAFPAQDIWDFPPLKRFVKSLWSVDPNAVGDPVLLYVFTLGFRNSILWATGIAVVAIAGLLAIFYRSLAMAMLALIPLWVGTGLTLILVWLLHIPFNQANVLFLPLVLGEGIEFGIIILTRWQQESTARAITLPASTAKGVALAALTTTVGFGSLMISSHQGTFSLGLLATVGSLCVLSASLSVLPAFLNLVEKGWKPDLTRFYSLLGGPARDTYNRARSEAKFHGTTGPKQA